MNRLILAAIAGLLLLAGCSGPRELDDAQLAQLLRSENARPDDAGAPLDRPAVECMRAWSGDAELMRGLSVRYAGEDGKKACRTQLEIRIQDEARNPHNARFEDLTHPATVRRAMALLDARKASSQPAAAPAMPPARPPAAPGGFKDQLGTPDPSVDLGAAGARLQEAEALCLEVRGQVAARPDLKRFADFCGGSLRRLRTTLEQSARRGAAPEKLAEIATSADNVATTARNLLAAPPR
ncbi:MAG: hypothetical protein J0H15_08160 [Xanthomonadales bacterium]|nr:hypothetical protein [Xanthomonadales bacterium]